MMNRGPEGIKAIFFLNYYYRIYTDSKMPQKLWIIKVSCHDYRKVNQENWKLNFFGKRVIQNE